MYTYLYLSIYIYRYIYMYVHILRVSLCAMVAFQKHVRNPRPAGTAASESEHVLNEVSLSFLLSKF